MIRAALLFASAVVAAAVGGARQPSPLPSSPPEPSPTSPAPAASSTPTSSATQLYHLIVRPTPGPIAEATPFPSPGAPQILEIDLSDAVLVTPGILRVRVLTTDEVTTVRAETFGRTLEIPKFGPGDFRLEANVGGVPVYLRDRTYDVDFQAAVADGRTANLSVPLTLK